MDSMLKWTWMAMGVAMGAGVALAQPAAREQPSTLPALSDRQEAASADGLGAPFESPAAGIAFRPPAGGKLIRRATNDDIVSYVNDEKNWVLKVTLTTLSKPLPLKNHQDENGRDQLGMMDLTLEQFKRIQPGAEVLRQDVTPLTDGDAGMLVLRYSLGTTRMLNQQAIIHASDYVYYTLSFTTPAAKNPDAGVEDPAEREAVTIFRKVLDSVKLLDRTSIRLEQNERLYRTRALYLNLTDKRIREALVPEQWLRLMRDGKDIGYTYIVEETEKRGQRDGVKIGIRSRTVPEADLQVDAETWMYCTFDRAHGDWTNTVIYDNPKKPQPKKKYTTEIGISDLQTKPEVERPLEGQTDGKSQVREVETYTLTVKYISRSSTGQPINRQLPPSYLPQALGQLLPRLLPREPATYMFYTYVGDRHEVMARYVDVESEQPVTLDGRTVRAIPIKDRIGLEGSPTYHYVSPDGKYLGSENKDSKILILPTDAETLKKIWISPTLTRPSIPTEGAPPEPEPSR
jgi:hypothetical protein